MYVVHIRQLWLYFRKTKYERRLSRNKLLLIIIVDLGTISHFYPMLLSTALPKFHQHKRRNTKHRSRLPTAASSGLNAPFAMLCLPALSLWLLFETVDFADPSLVTSSARHSSSVAGWPSRREKNLCRRTVFMRSNACELYHPSRS